MIREIDEDLSRQSTCNMGTREFDERNFKTEAYICCREGLLDQLTKLVQQARVQVGLTRVRELLDEKYVDEDQEYAPLLIAAKEGHVEICDLLIYEYKVDVETEGTVIFDTYKIEGATPLWCSAGANHMTIVMMLIKSGADINHSTRSRSTPLRAACFDGKVEMVELLLDHKADFTIANKFENTCLMIAAYKGHTDVVKCLLKRGAPPNARALCGNTALQFAAENGRLAIIEELIKYNSIIHNRNNYQMTPLISAAERAQPDIVEYFIMLKVFSREETIDALELLGASFANDKDSYDLEKCYKYLRAAMVERMKSPVIPKPQSEPVPAYENRIECQTLEEVDQIKYNANALQMEGLTIRERILGPSNPEIPHHVTYRGAVFADASNFERSLELWLHSLTLRENKRSCLARDLLRFSQLFCQMLHVGVTVPMATLLRILRTTSSKVELQKAEREKKPNTPLEDADVLPTTLYLLVVVTQVLQRKPRPMKDERKQLDDIVKRLVKINLTNSDLNTLLHQAVNGDTPTKDFHVRNICHFPHVATTRLLIKCGANVNAVNKRGETPLHLIMRYKKAQLNPDVFKTILSELLENGAHPDICNHQGQSPMEVAVTDIAKKTLGPELKLSLKCFASRTIQKYGIEYEGIVPQGLLSFIAQHRCRGKIVKVANQN